MTSAQVNSLRLQSDDVTLYSGSTVFYMLREYSARYMICDSVDNFLFKWSAYNGYKLPDFIRAYNALYAEYNPLNNYDMTEKSVDMQNDGDITRTRSTDAQHNKVTTTNGYDYSTDTTADSTDKPTVENYTTTYDDASTGRLASYSVNKGKTTQHTTADAADNVTEVTDDMTVSNVETHSITQMTLDDTTYTADKINSHEMTRQGNIGVMSTVDLIKQELSLRSQSLIYDYVYAFIERYTFYAAGGECYEYTVTENN